MNTPLSIISASKAVFSKRFGMCRKKMTFVVSSPPSGVSDIEWLKRGIEHIIDYIKEDSSENDKIGFTFSSPHFQGSDAYVAFKPAQNVFADDLLRVVGGLMQSNRDKGASWNDKITIDVTRVRKPIFISAIDSLERNANQKNNPLGSSQIDTCELIPSNSDDYDSFKSYCKNKRGVVWIDNTDGLSLPKAIVVGKAKLKNDPEYELIRKNRKNRQSLKAKMLLNKARLRLPIKVIGLSELKLLQAHLKKYNLKVYQYIPGGYELAFDGTNSGAEYDIKLIRCNGHYNVIVK